MARFGAMAGQMHASTAPVQSGRLDTFVDFGTNPGALLAHSYRPAGLPDGAPLVVVLHGCTQTAEGYDRAAGWSQLADRAGFALLFPEQRQANNPNRCFNWFGSEDIARSGGEADSIAQMVQTMVRRHDLDPSRVFITGLSAGGAMTATMLAVRPDLFAAGAIIAGLPHGSATTMTQAFDRMRGHGGADDRGLIEAVQGAAKGRTGAWPSVSIWHGDADATVDIANADALARQWCGVHGLDARRAITEDHKRYTRSTWSDAKGYPQVARYVIRGLGHGTPIDPNGPDRLGTAAPHMIDVGIDSTMLIADSWGLIPPLMTRAKPSA